LLWIQGGLSMPTVVKTSACCAIFELALRLSHALSVALMLRHFLSLIIYVYAWIPTVPKNALGNTYSCPQHIVSSPSTLFLLCYRRQMWESTLVIWTLCYNRSGDLSDFPKQIICFNRVSSRGPPQPGGLGFDKPDWRSVWKPLYVPFPLNLGFISTEGRRS